MLRSTLWILVACMMGQAVRAAPSPDNPASALCRKDGAAVVIETAPNGSLNGVCVFPSGARMSAAAYFRNKHRTKY